MTLFPSSYSSLYVVWAMLLAMSSCSTDTGTKVAEASPDTNNSTSVIDQPLSAQEDVPFSNTFDDARLTEVSGLQRSRISDGIYYVNNDSGTDPLIYLSDSSGQVLGSIDITNAEATDWEALAGAQQNGINKLIIADIGNNVGQRQDLQLWVIDEPTLNELDLGFELEMTADRIALSYSDGIAYDAEALFVDGDNDTIVLLTKNTQDTSAQSIWKGSLSSGLSDGSIALQYDGLVNLPSDAFINAITGVDLHPNGREIAVLTYGTLLGIGNIHLWTPSEGEATTDALLRPSDEILSVPNIGSNLQAESVSYSADGNTLLVGAEAIARSTLTVIAR